MSTVQTAVGRFVWHDCNTSDVEAAKTFYRELFGWEIDVWKPGEMDYPMISSGGGMHGGFGPAQGGAPSHWLGHVAVESADGAAERAQAAGGQVLFGPMDIPEVGRMVVIADPQGGVSSAFQPESAEWAPDEGVFVWDELLAEDVEAAKAFYTGVYGWTTGEMDMGEAGVYTLFKNADRDVAGLMTKPPSVPVAAAWLVYIGTDDVDGTLARSEELGGKTMMGAFDVPGVGRLGVAVDPTGAPFGLFKPSE